MGVYFARLIAGLFISELLYATLFNLQGEAGDNGSTTVADLGKPALALLGGFSANMVYKMLQRIVESIESLFKGDAKDAIKARRAQELGDLKQKQDESQMALAGRLVLLTDKMETEPEKARMEMRQAINELLKK